ncbi:hypothetical protein PSTT_09303 [Puccinia striiformis]|uniref:Uncharacterized protein n=1 Tax=Puccinia striiformis TaxID=27350 RepID=A0A2S4V952_9BASI|nr:hypothetical protein PSTT_09303 [Puccinia striiformis]
MWARVKMVSDPSLSFVNCHNKHRHPRQLVSAKQYFRRVGYVSAQDRDGTWWDCNYEAGNNVIIACDTCS